MTVIASASYDMRLGDCLDSATGLASLRAAASLAREFEVSFSTACRVVRGELWR